MHWRDLDWLPSKRGGWYSNALGATISINAYGERWKFCVVKGRGGLIKKFSNQSFESVELAMAAAFDVALGIAARPASHAA